MKIPPIAALLLAGSLLHAAGSLQSEPRLLDLNVVVLDRDGQPVTDLTADDFQITDAGKPERIASFRRHDERNPLWKPPAETPEQFANRRGDRRRSATVILLDLMNMGYGTRTIAANLLVRDLSSFQKPGDLYLYMLSVNGRFLAVHGVSSLESPVSAIPEPPWTQQIKLLMDKGLRAVMTFRSPDIDVFVRTQMTFVALEALGQELAAVPGRKIIVWLTDGVPVALGMNRSDTGFPVDFTPQIRELSQALERSNIALYPVRQIMLGRGDDIGNYSDAGQTGGDDTGVQSLATLDLFADVTGGRRSAGKDIGAAVRQAMNDLHFYYQIGYDVPATNWNDKFHKLRVTCKRKGVRIQAKSGYYAWKSAVGTRTRSAFTATAAAPLDAEEIGLWANLSADPADPQQKVVNLRIDARDIALAEAGGRYTGHLGIMSVGYLSNGLIGTSPGRALDIDLSAAERDQALRDGIRVAEKLNTSQGASRFRIMVFDRGSNAVGSLTIPASGPPPAQP